MFCQACISMVWYRSPFFRMFVYLPVCISLCQPIEFHLLADHISYSVCIWHNISKSFSYKKSITVMLQPLALNRSRNHTVCKIYCKYVYHENIFYTAGIRPFVKCIIYLVLNIGDNFWMSWRTFLLLNLPLWQLQAFFSSFSSPRTLNICNET